MLHWYCSTHLVCCALGCCIKGNAEIKSWRERLDETEGEKKKINTLTVNGL